MRQRRLAPEQMWPAGEPGVDVRQIRLASGVRLRVVETGPRTGPPILFVHGWACSAYLFSRNLRAAAEGGCRAIAIDLVGHGLSDKPRIRGRYTLDAMVGDLFGALDALGLDQCVLAGQSMGGRIVLELALRAPERVRALVLLNAVGTARLRVRLLRRVVALGVLGPVMPHVMFRVVFRLGLSAAFGDPRRVTGRDVDEYWAPAQFPGFARAVHALLGEFSWEALERSCLARLRPPTLVVVGMADRLLGRPDLEALQRLLPAGSRTVRVDGAGHAVNEEAAEVVNRELRAFLGAVRPGVASVTPIG